MAEKLLVRLAIEIDGTAADELELVLDGALEELLLHAAMTRQVATGTATATPFLALRGTGIINHLVS